ncbi:MAG: hypothetical protein HZB26_00705 [Candidatus Hydrogenedentes bacterium]|nr:hypothetical protein [Candidatus Hydrogenedentota bacterium]
MNAIATVERISVGTAKAVTSIEPDCRVGVAVEIHAPLSGMSKHEPHFAVSAFLTAGDPDQLIGPLEQEQQFSVSGVFKAVWSPAIQSAAPEALITVAKKTTTTLITESAILLNTENMLFSLFNAAIVPARSTRFQGVEYSPPYTPGKINVVPQTLVAQQALA